MPVSARGSFAPGVALAVWLILGGKAWPQASLQDRQACLNADPAIKIAGCTAVIKSGRETKANLAVAYSNRAAGYSALGDPAGAIADAGAAIELDPQYADAYNERAWALHSEGRDSEALSDANEAVALRSNDPYSLETRAEIFEGLGRTGEAIVDYRAALSLDPDLGPAREGLKRIEQTSPAMRQRP